VHSAGLAGATVIGAAGRPKLSAVTGFGADHAVDYSTDDWPDRVRELTGGRGADLVLDAVGGAIVLTT
jgi:NADPH:quinone reductase